MRSTDQPAQEAASPPSSGSHLPTEVRRRRPAEERVGVVVMAALVLITMANVLVRYFSNQSFAWTEEISVFLLVAMTLAGAAMAAAQDAHIRIEFFYARGSARRRQWLARLSALGTAALFLLLTVLIVRTAWSEYAFGETSAGLGVPRWWYTAFMPLLALLVAVRALVGRWRRGGAQTLPATGMDEARS